MMPVALPPHGNTCDDEVAISAPPRRLSPVEAATAASQVEMTLPPRSLTSALPAHLPPATHQLDMCCSPELTSSIM